MKPISYAIRSRLGQMSGLPILPLLALALSGLLWSPAGPARADISSPGDHPTYGLELEGHLVAQWHRAACGDAFGPGFRAYFPVVPQGPVPSINNSLQLGIGADLTFADNCARYTDSWQLWLPVSVQWNFFFSRDFSVFPELGLALRYLDYSGNYGPVCDGRYCYDDSSLNLRPVFWLGIRYMFADSVGVTLRLGSPSLLLGINFLL